MAIFIKTSLRGHWPWQSKTDKNMKYYIIAGEASGDLHGSNLMKGIYAEDPQADVRFWEAI